MYIYIYTLLCHHVSTSLTETTVVGNMFMSNNKMASKWDSLCISYLACTFVQCGNWTHTKTYQFLSCVRTMVTWVRHGHGKQSLQYSVGACTSQTHSGESGEICWIYESYTCMSCALNWNGVLCEGGYRSHLLSKHTKTQGNGMCDGVITSLPLWDRAAAIAVKEHFFFSANIEIECNGF